MGAPILLVHCATQKPLCLENQKVPNDYGIELELSARSALGNGMKLAMEQMFQVGGRRAHACMCLPVCGGGRRGRGCVGAGQEARLWQGWPETRCSALRLPPPS